VKTKYILHGGSAQKINSQNDDFFKEILKNTPNSIKILLVHFASDSAMDDTNHKADSNQFIRVCGSKKLIFKEASEFKFVNQAKWAEVIYFGGGETSKLLAVLKKFSNLKKLFEGKIIAGESAGANSLSAYCYSQSSRGILKGLALLPTKTICHYEDKYKESFGKNYKNLETLFLPIYQFKVFKI